MAFKLALFHSPLLVLVNLPISLLLPPRLPLEI
jgi:hypothetical protein